MQARDISDRGTLTNVQLGELADQLDPAIGEASTVLGAVTTELIRRSLRGGVLQIGRELSGYVATQVEREIVEQRPLIEKTAGELATEVARNEVQAVRQAAHDQAQQLAARIDDTSRQAQAQADTVARDLAARIDDTSRQAQAQADTVARDLGARIDDTSRQAQARADTVARDLAGRLDDSSRQTHEKIDSVSRVVDDTARQSSEAAASLARTLQTEVAAVETRTLEKARRDLDSFHDRARQTTVKIKDRLGKLETANTQLAELQRAQKQQFVAQIDELRRANKSLADRIEILERPRGLRRLFAWLFGKNKKPAPAEPVVEAVEESERD
jgi:hypothetical protein